jgi:flagellar motor switch protein FliN/FliY
MSELDEQGVPAAIAAIRMPVHAVLGRVTRTLGEIFKLDAGTVVDLERAPADPVEIVVNGRVIAWGDLVVSNGNYAIQITGKTEGQEAA